MGMNSPKDGAPGTTDQSPRWEGPQRNKPRGYLLAKDDPDKDRDAYGETNSDPEIRHVSDAMNAKERQMNSPRKDAEGQFAKSQGDRKSSSVHSARPTVVTGSEDATVHRNPPGEKKVKDWDVNYDPAETNEGKSN